ncbi:redox-sensing transcriptional repressor [Austwickia chelonae]|uniref:Redox-sensing transcriptional repressor Rex n=1 Tax=Austwickia chelonae NBRC 105200 TaxID=1184607 RepID=K6V437_9MICO|nr:redox-sensing transcriptional repressor Rex [Austwickia chelonae]GAB76903.1 redox-sensing transcriptional repressor Rex [Austwickia chelonae NBRC 105200]SEW32163.1 redox-sensing transcriptional repressor [Austwickia chelonae]
MSDEIAARRGMSEATIARLPDYLHVLGKLIDRGTRSVSSRDLAAATGVSSAQVRKDLSLLGSYGVRGVGYDTAGLAGHIAHALGLSHPWPVVIVGAGRLGKALVRYPGLDGRGFAIVALFDSDPALIGTRVEGVEVHAAQEIPRVISRYAPVLAVIATPEDVADEVCTRLVEAGVTGILNFAPTVLPEPPGVHLRQVDLANELQILAFHAHSEEVTV